MVNKRYSKQVRDFSQQSRRPPDFRHGTFHRRRLLFGFSVVLILSPALGLSNPPPFVTTVHDHKFERGSLTTAKCIFHNTIHSQRLSVYSPHLSEVAPYKAFLWQSGLESVIPYTSPKNHKIINLDQIQSTNYFLLTLDSLKIDILESSASPIALSLNKHICINPAQDGDIPLGEFVDTYHHKDTNWIIGSTTGGYLVRVDYTIAGCSSSTHHWFKEGLRLRPGSLAYLNPTTALVYYLYNNKNNYIVQYEVMPSFGAIIRFSGILLKTQTEHHPRILQATES